MNLVKICDDIITEKNGGSKISVRKCEVQKLKPPFGSIHVYYEKDGIEETEKFLTKYIEKCNDDVTKLDLFEKSHYKETLMETILNDIRKLFEVSFPPEIHFSNEEIVIYNIHPNFHECLLYTETYFNYGISTLAKFHAVSMAYVHSDKKNFNIEDMEVFKEYPFSNKNLGKISQFILKDLDEMRNLYYNTFLDDISPQNIESSLNNIQRNLEALDQCTKVLINGNYDCGNLIYSLDFSECKITDFSYAAYQWPILDLFQFVFSYSKNAEWHKYMEKAITLYYDALIKEVNKYNIQIKEVFAIEEYKKTYELLMPIMKLTFYPKIKQNINSACLKYVHLAEVLSILKLNKVDLVGCAISFADCYWVYRNLKKEHAKLVSYRTKSQSVKNGFLGEYHDFEIELNYNGKQSKHYLFLKGIPHSEALKEFESTVGSFFKETMFYARYIPLLKKYNIDTLNEVVPTCYFADQHKYIVLENLLTHGYSTLSPRDNPRNDVIIEVLKILAKLHSSCIILEELVERETGCKYRMIDNFRKEFNEPFYSTMSAIEKHRIAGKYGMETLIELIDFDGEISVDLFKDLASEACNEQLRFAQPSSIWRNTICHGDFWSKNYMVKIKDDQIENVIMIDFQTYRYAPPAQDLMAFIFLNSNAKLRKNHMSFWLELYYSCFSENLKKYSIEVESIISTTEFQKSCKFYEQFAVIQSITHFQVIMASSEIINAMLSDQNGAREIFFDRCDLVKKLWIMDEIYKEKLTEAVSHLRSYFISRL